MITFLVLAFVIFLAILIAFLSGGAIILVFGDLIVFGFIVWGIYKLVKRDKE